MKKRLTLLLMLAALTVSALAQVELNSTNFPDANFLNYLKEKDTDGDTWLSDAEIQAVTKIDLIFLAAVGKMITDLKGIEYFTALTELNCSFHNLTTLDVTKNTALKKLSCNSCGLTNLYFKPCKELTSLSCYSNDLESLDISNNKKLKELRCFTNEKIQSLDVSNNTALEKLYCYECSLTSLDVTNCTALTTLSCFANQIDLPEMGKLIESLPRLPEKNGSFVVCKEDASPDNSITTTQVAVAEDKGWAVKMRNTNGTTVAYAGEEALAIDETNFPDEAFRNYLLNQSYGQDGYLTISEIKLITSLDLRIKDIKDLTGIEHFTAITYLDCSSSSLKSLDVSKNTALKDLYCSTRMLESLNVSGCEALIMLDCNNNMLESLDLSGCKKLFDLKCGINKLTSLDLSECKELMYLSCDNNMLESLNVSGSTTLEELYCGGNSLTSLNVSTCTALKRLSCVYNSLTSLNVSTCTALQRLTCYNNSLTSLDVSGCTALRALNCSDNSLTSLNVSGCTALQKLTCYNNSLTSLDVSGCTALRALNCSDNSLTSLNVSGCTALRELYCGGNSLTSLNVSTCTALQRLSCVYNSLTSLNVSACTALAALSIYRNQISGEAMTELVNSLPEQDPGTECEITVIEVGASPDNVITVPQVNIATGKGWKVKMHDGTNYVEYAGEKIDAKMSFSPTTATAVFGTAFTAPTLTVTPESLKGSVTYTSSNKAVATVNKTSGEVKLLKAGETTITAKFGGNDTYAPASASYVLTVKRSKDLNGDGDVNIADVVTLLNAVITGSTDLRFDINNDGKVDAGDVTALVNG